MSTFPTRMRLNDPGKPKGVFPKSKGDYAAEALLNPTLFAEYFLQAKLWDVPSQIVNCLLTERRIAVKACHASGKTFTAAQALLWFLVRYQEAIIVTTAPTWTQVEKLLWGEVHSALSKSRYPFPKATLTELKIGPKRYAYGLSTSVTQQDEGVRFQGIHADNVLVIMDEAPGVDPKIWEAIEGARAGGNVTVLAIGNPTIASGPFHEAFHAGRDVWKCFTIDAFDTPNFVGVPGATPEEKLEALLNMGKERPEFLDENVAPYLTTRRWVFEKYFEWGLDHPSWQSRVRGQFPKQAEDALISLAWLEAASRRQLVEYDNDIWAAGVDIAGPGEDETTLTIRHGATIKKQFFWPHQDPRGQIVAELNKFKDKLQYVNVDSIGIGWYIHLHLKDQGFNSVPVNISEQASDTEKYANAKAEFYWGLRMRAEKGDLAGVMDEKTIGQLAGIRYKHNARGQIEIESKEQASKRGVKSPDRAESIMLAFAKRDVVYGVLDYNRERVAQMDKVDSGSLMKPATTDQSPVCEVCSAKCMVRTNGALRCNQCGHLKWDNKALGQTLSRKDILSKMRR